MIPDLPLDTAVWEYSVWQQTRVNPQVLKDNVEKACDIALTNGLDLRQINKERFFSPCLLKDLASSFYGQGSLDGQHAVQPSATSLPGTNCYKEAFIDKDLLVRFPTFFFLALQQRGLLFSVVGGSSEGVFSFPSVSEAFVRFVAE
ncbi:hypothetical protein BJX65DRAFT_313529 [Aspergillus insuetus]